MASVLKVDEMQGVTNTNEMTIAANNVTITGEGTATMRLQQGLCKAWCFLDGYDAAIHDSFNVSHETDEGTGAHQVSFTSNMNNVTFAIANNRSRSDTGRTGYDEMTCNDKATDGFSLNTSQTSNNNGQDNSVLDAHIMGDLA